jgi:hypothetical protein
VVYRQHGARRRRRQPGAPVQHDRPVQHRQRRRRHASQERRRDSVYLAHGTGTYSEGAGIVLRDATLASATITVTNHQANDLLSINGALPGNITASAFNPGTGVLTLSSAGATATLAQWHRTAPGRILEHRPEPDAARRDRPRQ